MIMKKKSFILIFLTIIFLNFCSDNSNNYSKINKKKVAYKHVINTTEKRIDEIPIDKEKPNDKDFKEIPCENIEYYIAPGTTRDISFSYLSLNEDSEDDWFFLKNEIEQYDISITLNDISSESVQINSWELVSENENKKFNFSGMKFGSIWLIKSDEETATVFLTDMSITQYHNLSESDILERLENIPTIKRALDKGIISLSQSSIDIYINFLNFTVDFPANVKKTFMSGLNIILQKKTTDKLKNLKILKQFKIKAFRMSNKGNCSFFGDIIRPSCFE